MSDIDNKSLCKEAELYYLSVVFGTEFGELPEKISRHIESCNYCQSRLIDLKNNLNEENTKTSANKDLLQSKLKTLEEHLSHTGKEINCAAAKPYLPLLLEQGFEISVPTPITTHLDNCQGCQKNFAAIKSLGLKLNQLEVLSRFLSSQGSPEQKDCPAAEIIRSYADFDFKAVQPEIINHIDNCNLCRILAYQIREKKLENLKNKKSGTFLMCNDVSFADLFDYCLPSQAAIGQGLNIEHISQCPKCLDKIQLLYAIILEIKQKPQSGVATKYQLTKLATSDKTSIYDGFPVQVQTVISADKQKSLGKNTFRKALKYITRGAAAAAIIFAIALFIHNSTTATAIDAEQVFEAINNATSIHKIRYTAGSSEPIEEEWASKPLNIYILKTSTGISAWNIAKGKFVLKSFDKPEQNVFIAPETTLAVIRDKIRNSFGMIPFQKASDLPNDAQWKKIDNIIEEGFEVYELSWVGQTQSGEPVPYKWRTYINLEKKLPEKLEFYMKLPDETGYIMTDLNIVEYASNDEILRVFQEYGLDDSLLGVP